MREMTIVRPAEYKKLGSVAFFSLMLCLAMVAACATVGPDFKKPEPMIENEWIEKESSQIKTESGDYSSWWEVFQDPVTTQQALVSQQDSMATSQGDIDRYLIAVYKAMGGGWQIRLGKEIIPEQTLKVMRDRTDWGKILEPTLPDEQQDLPTGKDVKLFNKLKW